MAGRFAAEHFAPRFTRNVVFQPFIAYPITGCIVRQGDILFALQSLIIELPSRQITARHQDGVASPTAIRAGYRFRGSPDTPAHCAGARHLHDVISCYVMTCSLRRACVIVQLLELVVDFAADGQLFRVT